MAAWIDIFCKRSLAGMVPEQVRACIDVADWHTLAEGYDVEDEMVVDRALKYFRIEQFSSGGGDLECDVYRVYYRRADQRQIDIWRPVKPEQIAEHVSQERAELAGIRKAGAKEVRQHLTRIKDVVSIELGWNQLEGMAVVLVYGIARWLAEIGRGWVKDHEDQWWALTRRGAYKRILSP